MTIIEPSGEADYDESAVLIADELKAIGLNVVPETLPFSTWFSGLLSGDYWMARFWGMGAVPAAAQQFLARLPPKTTNESAMGFRGFMWINLSEYPFMEYLNRAMQYWLVNNTLYDYYINRVGMLWVETLPSISPLYPYSPYEYVNETITGFPSQGHDYWASYWLIGWPAALLCLHQVNQSVPEPWWYYYSAYSMDQVPEQWVTSNDPYVTAVTTTTPITTTSTTTSTSTTSVTSVTTSTITVTSTSTSTFTTTVYRYVTSAGDIAAAVIVTAVVVALAVWAVMRRK
jgi:peptide/nickel transport system substrate-binding protein